jgi:hypothetical protein
VYEPTSTGSDIGEFRMSEGAEKLRQRAWDEYMAAYQEEFGEFADEELARPIPAAYVSGRSSSEAFR